MKKLDLMKLKKSILRIKREYLKLNYKKCELMTFGQVGAIRMRDGTRLKPVNEAKYLGCYLNNRADGTRES